MTESMKETSNDTARRFAFLAQWRLSETLALTAVCLLGVVILAIHLCTWGVQTRREALFNEERPCVVVESAPRSKETPDGLAWRPEVTIRYEYNGETYSTTTWDRSTLTDDRGYASDQDSVMEALAPFAPGVNTTCWINSKDPRQAILVKRSSVRGWIFLLIPTLLILSGGALLASRLRDRVFSNEARANAQRRSTKYPTLPVRARDLKAPQPGEFRALSPDARSTFAYAAGFLGALVWNVASWIVFIYVLITAETTFDVVSAWCFFAVFCGIGFLFACRLWGRRRIERAAGSVELDVSAFPITPGRKVKCDLTLGGRILAKRLDVELVCDETARFTQGTNTVVHQRRIYEETVRTQFDVDVPAGEKTTERFVFIVPLGAMHSFRSEHNEIVWKLIVKMGFGDGSEFARDFEIIVLPFTSED